MKDPKRHHVPNNDNNVIFHGMDCSWGHGGTVSVNGLEEKNTPSRKKLEERRERVGGSEIHDAGMRHTRLRGRLMPASVKSDDQVVRGGEQKEKGLFLEHAPMQPGSGN